MKSDAEAKSVGKHHGLGLLHGVWDRSDLTIRRIVGSVYDYIDFTQTYLQPRVGHRETRTRLVAGGRDQPALGVSLIS